MDNLKRRRLLAALTEVKGHYKLVKKGRRWLTKGLFVAVVVAAGSVLSTEMVFADQWQANTPNQVRARLVKGARTFRFEKGDTFWAIGQVLNIKAQVLMAWNGYQEGDQYHIPVGTIIYIDGNHVTITDKKGQIKADKIVKPEQKNDPNKTVMNQVTDQPSRKVVADANGNVISSADNSTLRTQAPSVVAPEATSEPNVVNIIKPKDTSAISEMSTSEASSEATSTMTETSTSGTSSEAASTASETSTSETSSKATSTTSEASTSEASSEAVSTASEISVSEASSEATSTTSEASTSETNSEATSTTSEASTSEASSEATSTTSEASAGETNSEAASTTSEANTSEASSEATSTTSETSTSEASSEATSTASETSTSETSSEATSTTSETSASEASSEATSTTSEASTSEASSEATSTTSEASASETNSEATSTTSETSASEASSEATSTTSGASTSEAISEAVSTASETSVSEASSEATSTTSEASTSEASSEATSTTSETSASEASSEATSTTSEASTSEASSEAVSTASETSASEASSEATSTSENTSTENSTSSEAVTPGEDENTDFPKNMDDVKPERPAMPTVDTTSLQLAVINSTNVLSQASYLNADPLKQAAYQSALKKAQLALTNSAITSEEVSEVSNELNVAKTALDGKVTDISDAQKVIEASEATKQTASYKNATLDKRKAYDQALANLEQQLQLGATNLTQAEVDKLIAKVDETKANLDGKPLSEAEQTRADAIRTFQDTYDYYENAIAMLPADSQYVAAAKQLLDFYGIKDLDNEPVTSIENKTRLLKYIDYYIAPVKEQMAGRQSLEEEISKLEDLVANKITITNEITRLNDLIAGAKKMLADPDQAINYADKAEQLSKAGNQAITAQAEAVQALNAYNQARAEALQQLMADQVKGKDTYIELITADGKYGTNPKKVVARAELMEKTLPFQGSEKTGAMFNPEYLQYETVDDYLQVGTDAYEKMMATVAKLEDQIRKEFEMGRGDKVALLNDPSKLIRTVPTDEDVEALKPFFNLADAFTARSLENINRMRFAVGLYPLQKAPINDKRKAMAFVHALAGYIAGQIAYSKDNTTNIKSSHVGTVAALLAPHAMTAGWNENVYPSSNMPLESTHLTPEYLADLDNRIVLEEGIRFYGDLYKDPDAFQNAGHFMNMLTYTMGYYYATPVIHDISKETGGFEKYKLSITELFYAQATEKYKEMLRHFDEWPQINPETDLNRTDFSNLKGPQN